MTPWRNRQPKAYYDLKASKKPISVHQGGARSGKTWSILQVICEFCWKNKDKGFIISIVRKTTPALRASAYRDFLDILIKQNWYDESYHNKTAMEYTLHGNLVEFFAVDQPQKMRGRRRHICFINEANELTYEEFFQLNIRTIYKMILDFNPSDEFHWLYDLPQTQIDKNTGECLVDFTISNYTQNPYLDEGLIQKIEALEQADPDYWKVFGLGLRGASRELIFTHFQIIKKLPGIETPYYGQDFGFNVPSALVKVETLNGANYVQQVLYRSKMITADIAKFYESQGMNYGDDIYCDSAAADSIEELKRFGFDARKSNKDVLEGINKVKSMPLYITEDSVDLIKELRNYKWKKDPKTNERIDEPVKFNDHAVDAMRYAIYTRLGSPRRRRSFSYTPPNPN